MRIGIDARLMIHSQVGGFKTYTGNLISALAQVDPENEYTLYLDRSPCHDIKLLDCPNFASHVVPGQTPVVGMPCREQVQLARQAVRDQLDLFHAPSLTTPLRLACPLVVTIHDIIWLFPEKFSNNKPWSARQKLMEWYYRLVPQLVIVWTHHFLATELAEQVEKLGLTGQGQSLRQVSKPKGDMNNAYSI